ncbi:UpxY family transcription antiterminator [Prevotella sp. KH2C16]|uniref:UpxY family transcription antiterminator n=1 Tax=Prevotella sp. KH2C16 TaxID=1855325 RepID=UPI000B820C79|nr:UpxY family transcription antiterminator [Prevotella sp. KH2C16]
MDEFSQNVSQEEVLPIPNWGGRVEEDGKNWYAARLFTTRQHEIVDLLTAKGLSCFVPMEYRDVMRSEKLVKHALMPVVRNLIFIRKDYSEPETRRILADVPYKLSILRKAKDNPEYYEIPHRQMLEFQIMCNPELEMRKYLSGDEARLKAGTPVSVEHGPLKGLSGKLVRSSKKYYLLKEVPGMAVMIKVSRWCCKPLELK